jgi:hypothetical protein
VLELELELQPEPEPEHVQGHVADVLAWGQVREQASALEATAVPLRRAPACPCHRPP